jgi:hypothetical protein
MPGLKPGIQAAPSVIIRGRRPWMHESSPCMTKLKAPRFFWAPPRGKGKRQRRLPAAPVK